MHLLLKKGEGGTVYCSSCKVCTNQVRQDDNVHIFRPHEYVAWVKMHLYSLQNVKAKVIGARQPFSISNTQHQ